jgi:signal transduction histidine kinase
MAQGNSIRRQLILPLLAGFMIVTVLISGLSAWLQSSRSLMALRRHQTDVTQVLETSAFPLSGNVLRQMAGLTGLHILVWAPGASRIVDSSFDTIPDGLQAFLEKSENAVHESSVVLEFQNGPDEFRVTSAVSRWSPQYRIVTLNSQRALNDAWWNAAWPPLVIGAAALVAVVPWLVALTGNWSNRLRQIQRRVSKIAAGSLPPESGIVRNPVSGGDELAALIQDVTLLGDQLGSLQDKVLQAQKEQWIAQLAAGFAHQFRNGLAGISLALQVHRNRCGQSADRSLKIMEQQLNRLESEVRGLLSLGRRTEGIRTAFSIAPLVQECIELVSPAMEHHDVQLEVPRLDDQPEVVGIRDGLRAAIVNLLQNAVEAAGHQGQIRVQLLHTASHVQVEVSDNGPGPSREIADRLLESFVTTKPEGVGLGLAIVNAIVQDHGGVVNWRRCDNWTIMELSLPLKPTRATV